MYQPAFSTSAEKVRTSYLRGCLGMNRLTRLEIETLAIDRGGLRFPTHQVHFDRRIQLIPARFVREALQPKVAVEFTIDAREEIDIELGGDAFAVVVRGAKLECPWSDRHR